MKLLKMFLLFFVLKSFGQEQFEVFFDFNKDVPNEKSAIALTVFLSENKGIKILSISGYCDTIDDTKYNKDLAERRINAVLKLFKEKEILLAENIIYKAIGENFEQSINQEENRKVVFTYSENDESKRIDETISKTLDDEVQSKKVEEERSLLIEKFEKAKVGDRIAIYNINFKYNSETIEEISEPLLEELLFIMDNYPRLIIKIHGHICCNPNPYNTKLSFRRALKIFKYLRDNGIEQNRLAYNGVGSNNPIYPIPEKNEEERIANRRVEIEIVRK